MKNESAPETLTLEQAKEQLNTLFLHVISKIGHGSLQHKKLKIAQAVSNAAFSIAKSLKDGNIESAVDAIDEIRLDVAAIQSQPILNQEKFISGGFVTNGTLKNNLQVSGEPVHLQNKKASK